MTVPFMRAYTELLVATCHRRGAHAIGGMSAFIPNRRDPEVTARAIEQVAADKQREAGDGFDGTWVAHPDLIAVARAEFDAVLGDRPNQVDRLARRRAGGRRATCSTCASGRRDRRAGVRGECVGCACATSSRGCADSAPRAIDNLMEDAATRRDQPPLAALAVDAPGPLHRRRHRHHQGVHRGSH